MTKPGRWSRLRAHLRFGLGGLVLFVLFLASLAAVWVRWEAWAYTSVYDGPEIEDARSIPEKFFLEHLPDPIPGSQNIAKERLASDEKLLFVFEDLKTCIVKDAAGMFQGRSIKYLEMEVEPQKNLNWFAFNDDGEMFLFERRLYSSRTQKVIIECHGFPYFSLDRKHLLYLDKNSLHVIDTHLGKEVSCYFPYGPFDHDKEVAEILDSDRETRAQEHRALVFEILGQPDERRVLLQRKNRPILFDYVDGKTLAQFPSFDSPNDIDRAQVTRNESRVYLLGKKMLGWELNNQTQLFKSDEASDRMIEFPSDQNRIMLKAKIPLEQTTFSYRYSVYDSCSGTLLFRMPLCSSIEVLSDDAIVLDSPLGATDWARQLWTRRRPEWWWGHFYRPEVWVAIILGALRMWRVVRAVRARPTATTND